MGEKNKMKQKEARFGPFYNKKFVALIPGKHFKDRLRLHCHGDIRRQISSLFCREKKCRKF